LILHEVGCISVDKQTQDVVRCEEMSLYCFVIGSFKILPVIIEALV